MLSVIIITKNEAHDIRDCLESVRWANEIIVLDSGSTDNTIAICQEYTNKVFSTDWPGFGPQKNRALEKATGNWVLSLDADERIPPALQEEIKTAIQQNKYDAYSIPRQSLYCGKLIKYGAWHSKRHVRLFKRNCGKFDNALVHENIIITGKVGGLLNPMLHYTYQNLAEAIEKMNFYSSASALQRFNKGKKGGLFSAILHGGWAFLRSYFLQLGFLDGKAGFMLAVSNAEYSYYCYLKLMFLNQFQKTQ